MIEGINPLANQPSQNSSTNTQGDASQADKATSGNVPPPPSSQKVDSVNLSAAAQNASTQSNESGEATPKDSAQSKPSNVDFIS